jgi:hypothetical protein
MIMDYLQSLQIRSEQQWMKNGWKMNVRWKVDVCTSPSSSQDANDYIANGNKDSGLSNEQIIANFT